MASLELPKGKAAGLAGTNTVDIRISDRVQQLLADASDSPPNLAAALEQVQMNPGPTVDLYIESLFRYHCERTFGTIFGGQLLALEYIIAKGLDASIPHSDLSSFIRVHAEKAMAAGQTPLTDSQFVGFLMRHYLIRDIGGPGNPMYRGTFTGQQFLVYIKEVYPLGWNVRAL